MELITINYPIHDAEAGKKICELLNGRRTYLDWVAECCSFPCRGNEHVHITARNPHASKEELYEMALSVISDALTGLTL